MVWEVQGVIGKWQAGIPGQWQVGMNPSGACDSNKVCAKRERGDLR